VTFTSGAGTVSIKLKDAQSTTLTAAQGIIASTSGSFTLRVASASQLVYTTQCGGAIAGASFTSVGNNYTVTCARPRTAAAAPDGVAGSSGPTGRSPSSDPA
jgi:hypothetical protein